MKKIVFLSFIMLATSIKTMNITSLTQDFCFLNGMVIICHLNQGNHYDQVGSMTALSVEQKPSAKTVEKHHLGRTIHETYTAPKFFRFNKGSGNHNRRNRGSRNNAHFKK